MRWTREARGSYSAEDAHKRYRAYSLGPSAWQLSIRDKRMDQVSFYGPFRTLTEATTHLAH